MDPYGNPVALSKGFVTVDHLAGLTYEYAMGSLLEGIPQKIPHEIINTICATGNVIIERIVSRGHASPEGFWYDQEKAEFVLVVKGSAGLKLENEEDIVVLKPGDYLNIGARVKHRVEWTDPTCETIWLAVYF